MSSTKKQLKKVVPTVLPTATSSTTLASVSDPPVPTPTPTSSSTPVWSTTPPDVTLPVPPVGFVPVKLGQYRAAHPKAGELAALPDAITELESSTSYAETFGSGVPQASPLAATLTTAARWTALRVATEAFLLYAKSNEAITWKAGLADLDALDAVFQAVASRNSALVAAYPATARLLDVRKAISERAAVTRAAKAKASGAANRSAQVPSTAATPIVANAVVPAGSGSGTGGGVTH
jgi:hypothetical protein